MSVLVAIDPGVRPTLCRIDSDGAVDFSEETAVIVKRGKSKKTVPQPALIANILRRWAPDVVFIEAVQPIGKEAGKTRSPLTAGWLLHARGVCEGVAAGLGLPVELVHPHVWTRIMKVRVGSGPEGARQRALEILPALGQALARKGDHNRAAAFLIARYGRDYSSNPLL